MSNNSYDHGPDQTTEYTPGMFSEPSRPDHSPGKKPQKQAKTKKPATMGHRRSAVLLAVGALLLGGAVAGGITGGIGGAALAEADVKYDQVRDKRNALQGENSNLRSDIEGHLETISDLRDEVTELEEAPALLAEQRKAEEAEAKKEAAERKEQEAKEKAAKAKAERTFAGSGTFLVGEDIKPGTYKTEPGSGQGSCYWARLSGTSGGLSDIIANDNTQGPTTVTIRPSDVAFETNRCSEWERRD